MVEVHFWGNIDSCLVGLEPATLWSIAHNYPVTPSPRFVKSTGETVILITVLQTDIPIIANYYM